MKERLELKVGMKEKGKANWNGRKERMDRGMNWTGRKDRMYVLHRGLGSPWIM